jgi:phospholipase C
MGTRLHLSLASFLLSLSFAAAASEPAPQPPTTTPIRHVILVIGENRTFDNMFGTFTPNPGQTVQNLLSEGIVNADGTPGPNFARAAQWQAKENGSYSLHPKKTFAYPDLGPITVSGAPSSPRFTDVKEVAAKEPGLPADAYTELTTGGTGLPAGSIDSRFPEHLPDGPFLITRYHDYHAYDGSPVHRFFQMWQELDCDAAAATQRDPSGCRGDLFAWVEADVSRGSDGKPKPVDFDQPGKHEGAVALGYYDMGKGDAPYFDSLARQYSLSDNFHQAVMGGTGANHIELGFGTGLYYAAADGSPMTPPVNQIEDPDPQPGTDDFYKQDGYGGGSFVACADAKQPGVGSVRSYLASLPYKTFKDGDCQPHAYYLVNNYDPGYYGNGTPAPLGPDKFIVPPSRQPNLAMLLDARQVSWHYYGEGWDNRVEGGEAEGDGYCNICNPFQYSTQVMTDAKERANLKDLTDLYADIQGGTLPAVSIVKPDGFVDGHPASSKLELFEAFCRKLVDAVKANPALWQDTAIMITMDEGGGYYDSGYVQPIDFFGDGTRIPLIVVSPYSEGVGMVHAYADHVSFDKFVEANWKLGTISDWSRDRLPNPKSTKAEPYVPTNSPALDDLMGMFDFRPRAAGTSP